MSNSNFIFTPHKNSNYKVAINAQIRSAGYTGAGMVLGLTKGAA